MFFNYLFVVIILGSNYSKQIKANILIALNDSILQILKTQYTYLFIFPV